MRELARDPLLRQVEDDLLGAVDEVDRLAGPVEAEACDVVARADQAAQRRHLVDDPGVVGGVRRGRDERRELVHPLLAADVGQLAQPVELVDERDRVDRLALRVQPERGAVDRRVGLAVEVAGIEDLADRPDCAGGEHHRPEDRLLGIEVLGRDRSGCEPWVQGRRQGCGRLCHAGCSQLAIRPFRKGVEDAADGAVDRNVQAEQNRCSSRSGGQNAR